MDSYFQNEQGFTLVEVIVALAIFTIIGVATFSILQKAVAARIVTKRVETELFSASTTFAQLKNDLAQGASSDIASISGNTDSLRLHGVFSLPGDSLANVKLLYFVAPGENEETSALYRVLMDANGEPHTAVQLNGIVFWEISYLQITGKHVSWVGTWQSRQGLPRAVRVIIKLATWDEQQEYIYPVRIGGQVKPASQLTETPSQPRAR